MFYGYVYVCDCAGVCMKWKLTISYITNDNHCVL